MNRPTILVIEDNRITRRMLRVALESQGWSVVEAADGASAMRQVATGRFDLVVSDLTLPDADGFELLSRILASPGCADLPVIATSGFHAKLEEVRGLKARFLERLFKPVDPLRLIDVARAALDATAVSVSQVVRVLVVDDDPVQRRLLQHQLGRAGLAVETSSGGEAAMERARADPPDVIVSDVVMAEMDGFRLCAAVRSDPALARVAVVLISAGFQDEADGALARSVGASALLGRVPDLEQLVATVRACAHAAPPAATRSALPDDDYTRSLLRQLERQMAENAGLLSRLALHEASMAGLARLGETANVARTIEGLMPELFECALDSAGVSIGAVLLVEDGRLVLRAQHGLPDGGRDLARAFEAADLLARATSAREPLHIPATASGTDVEHALLDRFGARAMLVVPLRLLDELLGVLVLGAARLRPQQDWLPFTEAIGLQLAQAIALARAVRLATVEQERFRQLADAMPQVVWSATPDGVTDYLNARWYQLTGAAPGPVSNESWTPYIYPDDLPGMLARWNGAVASGKPMDVEYRLRDRDERYRWVLGRAVPWRDADGRLVRWFGTATDIDDQRRVLMELADREERLRQIADNIQEVFYMSTRDMKTVLFISPAYERIWGRTRQSLIERPSSWADAIHPADREHASSSTLERQARGEPYENTYRIIRPDGSTRWIHDRGYPVRDAAGEVTRFVGTATDITGLKQVEDDLRLLQGLTFEVIEAACTTDALSLVLRALCAATGWTLGQAWIEQEGALALAAVEGDGHDVEPFKTATRARRFARGEGLPGIAWATRRSRWVADLTLEPVFQRVESATRCGLRSGVFVPVVAGAEVVAVLEFFSTERRAEDRRLRELLTTICVQLGAAIRRKVAEEALRRTEAQLRQAQKMEAVGRLAGGIAHDFNNLLTAILGYTEVASTRIDARDPIHRDLEQVRKAGTRAAALTRQLLVFSRSEKVEPQVLCPDVVIGDMEKLLRRLIGEDIELVVKVASPVGRVKVDKGYLEQVLLNLCVNARDAMPRGGRLTLEACDVELDTSARMSRSVLTAPGRYVLIAVSDTGHGMDEEVLTHLFEPFFTTKEVGKGTGLGLTTVYGIVSGADGHIAVYSEPGVGTSFKVYLPRVEEAPSSRAHELPHMALSGSETILLVEDDEMVRDLAHRVLEQRGYEVLVSSNGGEALLLCEQRQGPIHLVLTDVVMPKLSGPDLVRRLEPLRPGLRVLFFSGYTSGAIQHAEALGSGRAFLQKPFTADALARKVREVLDAAAGSP